MSIKNAYPSKEIIPFHSVDIGMQPIITGIKASVYPVEVKRSAYILQRNETANGHSVVNGTNTGGIQSDGAKWPDKWDDAIVATCIMNENRTGKERGFVVFDTLQHGIDFMCERIEARGLYIGGTTHKITNVTITTPAELAKQYYCEWVEGDAQYHLTDDELNDFLSMYEQATKLFPLPPTI